MDAVVLVGGEGTRLRPLTYEIPKQMLPVVERPMIVHVVEWLASHGVDRAVLSLGYRADAFIEAFPSEEIAGVALEYVIEPEPLDTAGAIRFAADKAGVEDTFLVLNGDVLTDFDASALVAFHRSCRGQACIALTPVADPSRFGVVATDAQGRVTAFIEKPAPGEAPTNLINAGIYVLETSVLDKIPGGRRVSIERETFPELVDAGILYALASDAYWLDTGTPQQFLQAQLDVLSGRRLKVPPVPEIRVGVWVDESAEVVNDTIVGPGAVVGEDARLSGMTIIGVGAEVPAGSELDGARYPVS